MSKEKKEKPTNSSNVGKAQWTGKVIKEPYKGGRITSQAPPKPEKPKGK